MPVSAAYLLERLAKRSENIVYRLGGLPITIGALLTASEGSAALHIRRAYAHHYWHPRDWADGLEIGVACLIWPLALPMGALFFTWRNGGPIARRHGRPRWRQFLDQLRLAATEGVLPPWYYIFGLHEPQRIGEAGSYLNRCETKRGVYPILAQRRAEWSPLDDKLAFADFCRLHHLPAAPVLAVARDGVVEGLVGGRLPPLDLFVKPVSGCGGTGAQRWDHREGHYVRADGVMLDGEALLERLALRGSERPLLVQPRLATHPAIADLSNGALATVRVLTCLDEQDRPELVGAVFRMAVGENRTVDNLHAGGIASRVDLETGRLSEASDLGMDSRRGWLSLHPDSGAAIVGRELPHWQAVRALAVQAHRAFADRALVGWDIAMLADGPCLIEGNAAPDVDIMQRHGGMGLCNQRLGTLLAWHLTRPEPVRRPASPGAPVTIPVGEPG